MMKKFEITGKTKITRLAKRGSYEAETVYSILDEALYVTVAFIRDGVPFQIPTGHCRIGEYVYIHGSVGSAYMRDLAATGATVSIGATLMDGLVLARSAFHHSVNYRSVVFFSTAEKVTDAEELYTALEAFTNKIQPGRWADVRQPTDGEWKATLVLRFRIAEASAKIRTGGPVDDEEDHGRGIWAGVVPLSIRRGEPITDPLEKKPVPLPPYLKTSF